MAAPMKIPQHHIRQEVCEHRPTYREGRIPKAVKVYTINQESPYLLVQGVPALGAGHDLVKLFAIHGTVEEYRVLDEYPSADQFTDVYLIKFAKIQSARFAKKKLDDWSFLGGVLHVSYAPEFETLEETRLKLQERRRVVASRIRLHESEDRVRSAKSQVKIDQSDTRTDADTATNEGHSSNQDRIPSVSGAGMDNWSQENPAQTEIQRQSVSNDVTVKSIAEINYDYKWNPNKTPQDNTEVVPKLYVPAPPSTWIPPPPKPHNVGCGRGQGARKEDYPFARVPSSHATLPKQYVELSKEEMCQNQHDYHNIHSEAGLVMNRNHEVQSKNAKTDTNNKEQNKDTSEEGKTSEGNSEPRKNVKERIVNGLVVRDYSTDRPVPRFIPRQTLNLLQRKSAVHDTTSGVNKSDVDKDLKRNAFTLGKPQGPGCTKQSKNRVTEQEKSMEKTKLEIRKRVSEKVGGLPKKIIKFPP